MWLVSDWCGSFNERLVSGWCGSVGVGWLVSGWCGSFNEQLVPVGWGRLAGERLVSGWCRSVVSVGVGRLALVGVGWQRLRQFQLESVASVGWCQTVNGCRSIVSVGVGWRRLFGVGWCGLNLDGWCRWVSVDGVGCVGR